MRVSALGLAACLVLVVLLAACGGDDGDQTATPGGGGSAGTSTPSGTEVAATATPSPAAAPTEAPASPAATPSPVDETEVIVYEPPSASLERVEGEGCTMSVVLIRAWRCPSFLGRGDPCFGQAGASEVVCPVAPDGQNAYVVTLEAPLVEVTPSAALLELAPSQAWWVETADGARCGFKAGGTAPVVDGERVNFFCDDGLGLVGLPTPGEVWTARRVPAAITPPGTPVPVTVVELRTVWR